MKRLAQRQGDQEELKAKFSAQRQPIEETEEEEEMDEIGPLFGAPTGGPTEEEEVQMKRLAQAPVPSEGGDVDAGLEGQVRQAKSGGSALPNGLRASMEGAFGSDFSGVRVHTGPKSDGLNRSMSARAFTTGQDIFMRRGEYGPGNPRGQELLAHELTQVVQQNNVPAKPGARASLQRNLSDLDQGRETPDTPATGQMASIQREFKPAVTNKKAKLRTAAGGPPLGATSPQAPRSLPTVTINQPRRNSSGRMWSGRRRSMSK